MAEAVSYGGDRVAGFTVDAPNGMAGKAFVPKMALTDSTGASGSEAHIGNVGGHSTRVTTTFTRPADTTAYASGDLVANSTTAASVVPLTMAVGRVDGGSGMIRRGRIRKSGTSTTNASFRIHFFRAVPGTIANGDNGVFSVSGAADYMGAIDVTVDRAFTDGSVGTGVPLAGSEIIFDLASGTALYSLIEARGAYTPISGETFAVTLEIVQD